MVLYPRKAGIYKLTCSNNGKIYVGKSVNMYKRLNRHKNYKYRDNEKYYLQNAILKHGWSSFEVEILEIFENFNKTNDNDKLLERESYFINLFDSTDRHKGYNICKFSTDTSGIPLTEDHKEKIRQSLLGRTFSNETIERMRKSQLGKTMSDDAKEKLRNINLGKKLSDNTKEKIKSSMSGKLFTVDHKENLRLSKLGIPRSEETKEKIRQSMLRRSQTM